MKLLPSRAIHGSAISSTIIALSILLHVIIDAKAVLRKPKHLIKKQLQHQKQHNQQTTTHLHSLSRIHRFLKEDTNDVDSLIKLLECDECFHLIKDIDDATEQFLHDYNDDEIVGKLCSDEGAGQILRKEKQLEKGLDPDAPLMGKGLDPDAPLMGKGLDPDAPVMGKGLDPDAPVMGKGLDPDAPVAVGKGLDPDAPVAIGKGLDPDAPVMGKGLDPDAPVMMGKGLDPDAPVMGKGLDPDAPVMGKGLDPDAPVMGNPFLICEHAFNALLIQQKEILFEIISDQNQCKAEVLRELDIFKGTRRSLEVVGGRKLGRYIIVPSGTRQLGFIQSAIVLLEL